MWKFHCPESIFEAYIVWNHVWKFNYTVTFFKNSTAVTNLTAATIRCLLASLNCPITFYRKMLKTTFEAYIVWNHEWKFDCPVTIYKNSTAGTNLTATTSRCLLASLNFPITFYREMTKTICEAYNVRESFVKISLPCDILQKINSC